MLFRAIDEGDLSAAAIEALSPRPAAGARDAGQGPAAQPSGQGPGDARRRPRPPRCRRRRPAPDQEQAGGAPAPRPASSSASRDRPRPSATWSSSSRTPTPRCAGRRPEVSGGSATPAPCRRCSPRIEGDRACSGRRRRRRRRRDPRLPGVRCSAKGCASPSVPTRALTVELLGRFQALVAADEVIDLLHNDPSVEVRARAARSLGRMGSPASRPAAPAPASRTDRSPRGPRPSGPSVRWAPWRRFPVLRTTLLGSSHHLASWRPTPWRPWALGDRGR